MLLAKVFCTLRRSNSFSIPRSLKCPEDPEISQSPLEHVTDNSLVQILEYLDTHAADQLSVAQAHSFIENAGTKPHGPTAKQAVELCYFMRSHGFDVYTKLAPQEHKIRLYIADRNAMNRNRDKLFWVSAIMKFCGC